MKDGAPLSWKHFQYGLSHLPKVYAREALRAFAAEGMAFAPKQDVQRWFKTQQTVSGWG